MRQGPGGNWPSQTGVKSAKWQNGAAVMTGGSAAIFLLLVAVLPVQLVMPVFAAVALSAGAGFALFGWWFGIRQESSRITCWDFASTCLFVGFAAGVLSDPSHVMQLSTPLALGR